MAYAPLKPRPPVKAAKPKTSAKASQAFHRMTTPVVPKDHASERAASSFGAGSTWSELGGQDHTTSVDPGSPPGLAGSGRRLSPLMRRQHAWDLPDRAADTIALHTDTSAAKLAQTHQARALTFGRHIAFGPGEFKPDEPSGGRLLRHELFHAATPIPAFSLDRKTNALRSVVERNSTEGVEELSSCELLWLKDALLGVEDEQLRVSLERALAEIEQLLITGPQTSCDYVPTNFDPVTGAVGRPSIPKIDGPSRCELVLGETSDGGDELLYESCVPLDDRPSVAPGTETLEQPISIGPAPGREDIHVELRNDPNSYQLSDEGIALRPFSEDIADVYTDLKHQEHTRNRADKRRDTLAELPEQSRLAQLEHEYAEAQREYELAERRADAAKAKRREAYDERDSERDGLRPDGRRAVNSRYKPIIDSAEAQRDAAKKVEGEAKKKARDAQKLLEKDAEYKSRQKLRNELTLLEMRADKQKNSAAQSAQEARAKLAKSMEKAISASERELEAAENQVAKYQRRVSAETTAEAKRKRKGKGKNKNKNKGPSDNGKRLAKAEERLRSAKRANTLYEKLWVRYWQQGETLSLVEAAQTIVVSHDGLEASFLRDPRDKKPEGAMISFGRLQYDSADNRRAFELVQANKGNPTPTAEQYAEFEKKKEPILNLILDLFVGSEGKPDTFITGSGGGVTLGPGFTGAKLGHMLGALKRDDPAAFERVFAQFGIDVVDTEGDKLSVYIPAEDFVHSIAGRQDAPLEFDSSGVFEFVGSAKEVFEVARVDPKLLYVMTAAAHDPTFRAEYVKFFLEKINDARDTPVDDPTDTYKNWHDFASAGVGLKGVTPEMESVWLLPFINGSIAGANKNVAADDAAKCLAAHPGKPAAQFAAQMWWAAADQLRHTNGSRWRDINKLYGGEVWFRGLLAGKNGSC